MESKRLQKTGVGGVEVALDMPNSESQTSSAQMQEAPRCDYVDAAGRGCHMLAVCGAVEEDDSLERGLCAFHARRLALVNRKRSGESAAAELLGCVNDIGSPSQVSCFLGNLIKEVTLKRISRRDGAALAYICRLLLDSFDAEERALGTQDRVEILRMQRDILRLRLQTARRDAVRNF